METNFIGIFQEKSVFSISRIIFNLYHPIQHNILVVWKTVHNMPGCLRCLWWVVDIPNTAVWQQGWWLLLIDFLLGFLLSISHALSYLIPDAISPTQKSVIPNHPLWSLSNVFARRRFNHWVSAMGKLQHNSGRSLLPSYCIEHVSTKW